MAGAQGVPGISRGRRRLTDGVLCCGNIVLDILVRPVEQLRWNATAWVDSIETSLGGNGANTAMAIASLGVPVRLLAVIGKDEPAARVLEPLRAAGVDVSLVSRADGPTPTTVVLINPAGDRMFLHRPGVSAIAFNDPVELPAEVVAGCRYFHLGNAFALPRMRRNAAETLRRARAAGLTTAMDAGWDALGRWLDDLGPALPHTDLLFVNEEEALKLTGAAEYAPAAARLLELGAGTVVVKRGGAGCSVFDARGRIDAPAYDVPVVDTTGAGDCFAGGFLAALARGLACNDAARVANAAGALNVERVGATTGLRSWEDTLAWMRAARVKNRL